jgi:hypothetical protein
MAEREKLPQNSPIGGLLPYVARPDGLVARGLKEIIGSQNQLLAHSSEVVLIDLFHETLDDHDFDEALRLLHALNDIRSARLDELLRCFADLAYDTCVVSYKGESYVRELARAFLFDAGGNGDPIAQDILAYHCSDEYQHTSYEDAEIIKWTRKAAEHGRATFQLALGQMYRAGTRGLTQDFGEALKWLLKAAEKNEQDAFFEISLMYFKGEGVKMDRLEGVKWFLKGRNAEESHPLEYRTAGNYAFEIGNIFHCKQRTQLNHAEAMKWFNIAADVRNGREFICEARFQIAEMYYLGNGVPIDYVAAYEWCLLTLKYSRFHDGAAKLGDELMTKLKPAQIAEARELAREWIQVHAS